MKRPVTGPVRVIASEPGGFLSVNRTQDFWPKWNEESEAELKRIMFERFGPAVEAVVGKNSRKVWVVIESEEDPIL